MTSIERDSPMPLYHQLKALLVERIESGEWRPGDLIPGEQELQDTYGLSRTTVRQAMRELEVSGLVTRYRGKGTFVSQPKVSHGPEPKGGLGESLTALGMRPGWEVLSAERVGVPADVAERLRIEPGTEVFRLRRLRLANSEPIGHHEAFVGPSVGGDFAPESFSGGGSLEYLRVKGMLSGSSAERTIEAIPATEDLAAVLDVEPGEAMLRIRRVVVAADGTPIEDLIATYRGDRFQYRLSSLPVPPGGTP